MEIPDVTNIMDRFVDVILPLPLDGLFTYSIPDGMSGRILPGMRLCVQFGRSRNYTALAVRTHHSEPSGYKVKPVLALLDETPSVTAGQMKLIDWLSDYYMCPKGDVMKAVLPAVLRPSGEGSLHEYRPRMEVCVRLSFPYDESHLNDIFESLSRSPKQADMLTVWLDLSGLAENPADEPKIVTKRALLAHCQSPSALTGLIQKGILENWSYESGRLPEHDGRLFPPNALNAQQSDALEGIRQCFTTKDVCLLHGVTSSGKTEVYIHLMKQYMEQGRQVLFLLPEIALTLHIMRRLQRVFGDDMCVYHSRCTDAGRAAIWKRQLSDNPFRIVVGARSAIFLPFRNLGLVIVDEEHDSSYKQSDPAPRYNGRNTALMLAAFSGAKALLGSATPSIESYYNATAGKYGLVEMTRRYMDLPLPEIEVVDVYELRRKKRMSGLLSPVLENYMRQAFEENRQVILFRNRRGYAPMLRCEACGWIPKCDSCDVSLTWHRNMNRLSCHYCGKMYQVPSVCPECGCRHLSSGGYGTEKVEDEIHRIFPKVVTGRLDLDTATSPLAYNQILQDFQDGVTDVLIGTQMVTKGLDFDRVSVVGILSADSIMGAPDFRSAERAFQMMSQVAGRAGRRFSRGHVVIQTRQADNPVYSMVTGGCYGKFYENEVAEREMFRYPPFSRIVSIYLKSPDAVQLDDSALWLGGQLRAVFGDRVLGPDVPYVSRIHMQYLRKLMLKVETGVSMTPVRDRLLQLRSGFANRYRQVTLYFDADPMDC